MKNKKCLELIDHLLIISRLLFIDFLILKLLKLFLFFFSQCKFQEEREEL